jgi:hypothetical protein
LSYSERQIVNSDLIGKGLGYMVDFNCLHDNSAFLPRILPHYR